MGHPSRLIAVLSILALGCGSRDKTDADATDVTEEEAVIDVIEELPCTSDDDCDNGLFCDGEETCDSGTCQPGTEIDCDDVDPCTMDSCDETLGDCVNDPLDADGDGYIAEEAPTGESCGGNDCNDAADDFHPDAAETGCDLLDKDCDGSNHEGIDDDEDGWIDFLCDGLMSDHTGYDGFGDCDDDGDHLVGEFTEVPENIYPGAAEGCDGRIDHDCDGNDTELDVDSDGDGYAHPSCDPPEGEEDCDDDDDTVYPGATEVCDMVDNDCDGSWADGGADDDGDTYLDETCGGDDCDDTDAAYNPGVTVDCDTEDFDCNGYPDRDQDGDGAIRGTSVSGWPACSGGTDCDDTLDTFHPGATLSCNSIDHDCNTFGDEDNDGDGHIRDTCSGGDDCDDTDATISPSGTVDCTTTDHDCNSHPDNDQDGDGSVRGAMVSGWVGCGGPDCNDSDATINPSGTVDCTTTDHDCSGQPDNDQDGDGSIRGPSVSGWVACGGPDCDDDDATSHPGGTVDCTTTDHDCNGYPDNDQDGDGYSRGTVIGSWPDCVGPDCDDDDDTIHPGATPTCDMVDDDCSGSWGDEAGADDDGDTFLDDTCTGGDDCDDSDPRVHPSPPPVTPDMCTADDYDCDSSLDALEALPEHEAMAPTAGRPAIAWSGSEYGVVWRALSSGYDVRFSRLDSTGVEIGTGRWFDAPTNISSVDIAWSGTRWGIVADDTSAAYLHTLAADGTDPQPPAGTTLNGSGCTVDQRPDIATDGTQFGIVWDCDTTRIIFALASTTGTVTDMTDIQDAAALARAFPAIAWNSPSFGVVWIHQDVATSLNEVYFDLVDPSASPLSTGHVADSLLSEDGVYGANEPEIAAGTVTVGSAGPGFGVVWKEVIPSPSSRPLHGAVFNLAGSSSTPTSLAAGTFEDPEIAWNGTNFGIVSQNTAAPADIEFVQMDGTGAIHGSIAQVRPTGDTDSFPDLVWQTNQFAAVWGRGTAGYFAYLWCTY